jgi:two-component system, chemotaxis family, chemotaxis protein CheY
MKTLIVEDDFTSRVILQKLLMPFGECHVAVNGKEAVSVCLTALESGQPYDLICLDIMMPEMDGQDALVRIRALEQKKGLSPERAARVIMTTALDDARSIMDAFYGLCDGYLIKPIDGERLMQLMDDFKLHDRRNPPAGKA